MPQNIKRFIFHIGEFDTRMRVIQMTLSRSRKKNTDSKVPNKIIKLFAHFVNMHDWRYLRRRRYSSISMTGLEFRLSLRQIIIGNVINLTCICRRKLNVMLP